MKRFHAHVSVENLAESVRFYAALFAAPPTVLKPDYAKWMLDDPRVNFAISQRGRQPGVDHLGIQVEDESELSEVDARLAHAGGPRLDEKGTTCCYAQSDKHWIADPQGIAWETFLTFGESTTYGRAPATEALAAPSAAPCCGPGTKAEAAAAGCCTPAVRDKAIAAGCGCS